MVVNNNFGRLESGGLEIDRGKPLNFKFNGGIYQGYQGDTLASALLANGIKTVGRSFKYHRPRGILSAGFEETNAIVQISGKQSEPNVLATTLPLYEGLEAHSVNCWPGVRFDIGAINEFLHRFFPAGFYYKTFMWPNNRWKFYGYFMRRAAGLGRAPEYPDDHVRYEKRYWHCDILVVGAGPAGLAAALAAARSGARVMLVDNRIHAGGSLPDYIREIDGRPAGTWVSRTVGELDGLENVIRLNRSTAVGFYDHNMVYVVEHCPEREWLRERLWRVRAKKVIHATGSVERPLTFVDNDRPGIMLSSAVSSYITRYAVAPGSEVLYFTNNNSAYEHAFLAARHGIRVAAVVDTREKVRKEIVAKASDEGVEVVTGGTIVEVLGKQGVYGVKTARLDKLEQTRHIACDLICLSGGWNPSIQLQSQSGALPVYDETIAGFVPGKPVQNEVSAGSAAGSFELASCLEDGLIKGRDAAAGLGYDAPAIDVPATTEESGLDIARIWELPATRQDGRAFLDFQTDVSTDDIRLALRENYASVELVKRYTTAGMGIDQGKIGNMNIIGVIAEMTASSISEIGTTTYRPMVSPVSFGVIAGKDGGDVMFPKRRSPIPEWSESTRAYMTQSGMFYRRPYSIPRPGETGDEAIRREALAARNNIAIYDGTPLGKFELKGPDSTRFLNLVYTSKCDDMAVGGGRLGFMLREDGTMFDDGVCFRMEDKHWFMFTSSGGAEKVYARLQELLQCEYRDYQVYLTDVTEQWVNICVCGPRVRELLQKVGTDISLDNDSFPFMGIRTGNIAGHATRIARVGFSGELSFEINVPADYGSDLWQTLIEAGEEFGITAIGTEALLLLRLEKGFIMPALEGDGYVSMYDAGMAWLVNRNKPDFIGKYALERARHESENRPHIVGLIPEGNQFVPPDGAPLIDPYAESESKRMIGHVTAGGCSPNLGHSIALAQLLNGHNRLGETVTISTAEKTEPATVCEPVFFDKNGDRMRN